MSNTPPVIAIPGVSGPSSIAEPEAKEDPNFEGQHGFESAQNLEDQQKHLLASHLVELHNRGSDGHLDRQLSQDVPRTSPISTHHYSQDHKLVSIKGSSDNKPFAQISVGVSRNIVEVHGIQLATQIAIVLLAAAAAIHQPGKNFPRMEPEKQQKKNKKIGYFTSLMMTLGFLHPQLDPQKSGHQTIGCQDQPVLRRLESYHELKDEDARLLQGDQALLATAQLPCIKVKVVISGIKRDTAYLGFKVCQLPPQGDVLR